MKRIAAFLKATTLGGLFVLLPVAVVFGLAAKTVLGVHAAAQAVMEKFAGPGSVAWHFPLIFSVLIVILIAFVLGLTMISRRGKAAGGWVERTLLFRMPGYVAVRAIVGGFARANEEGVVKPALLAVGGDSAQFVFVTEDHGDGQLTIFIPSSPNPGSGSVQIVPKDKVRLLNVRITDIGLALQQWGVGTQSVLAKDRAKPSATTPTLKAQAQPRSNDAFSTAHTPG